MIFPNSISECDCDGMACDGDGDDWCQEIRRRQEKQAAVEVGSSFRAGYSRNRVHFWR